MYQRILENRNARRATLEAFQEDISVYILGTCGTIATIVASVLQSVRITRSSPGV